MKGRFLLTLLLFVLMLPRPAMAAPSPPDKIAPQLWEEGGSQGFLIILNAQADLQAAYRLPDKASRARWVYARLRATAARTQGPLLTLLRGHGLKVRPFYIVNAIYVERGTPALLRELAARPDVARLIANPRLHTALPTPEATMAPQSVAAVEPNLSHIGAPEVWAMGYRGQGIVIGGQDTGYAWTHPALLTQYRGWDGTQASHDYNWHDAIHEVNFYCPADSPEPCDDYGHGTHTMGIAVGDDGVSNEIGVAPGAQWIGCRNMNAGVGSPASYLECFEFFLAPYPIGGSPDEGDPALAPDITTNSWACPPSEGCDAGTLQAAIAAERAAGIFPVVAAGNGGNACSTISDPPAIYADAFTIGATGRTDDLLASFSSRGPVTVDGSGRRKPDLTAPGISIRSAYPPEGYTTMSGTSMATPHVAGATALLWSAAPYLRAHLTATTYVLTATAVPIPSTECSSNGVPNNLHGWGRLDVHHAVTMALAERSTLVGRLCEPTSSEPLSGALVLARSQTLGELWSTRTAADGRFTLTVLAGRYLLTTPQMTATIEAEAGAKTLVLSSCLWHLWLPLVLRE